MIRAVVYSREMKSAHLHGIIAAIFVSLGNHNAFAQSQDLVLADFEGSDYGAWKVSGTAFGSGPAHGTLPGQMQVEGFEGHGLVNSFNGGDDAKGRLVSPLFKIERKYLHFLVGGGGFEGKTCLNLLQNGKAVRTATGPNTDSGGSERLQPGQWDVSEFAGQEMTIEIVDDATGGWGHINVDQIVQSDSRLNVPVVNRDVTREIRVTERYLNFPVKTGGPKRKLSLMVDGKTERDFDIELADADPDWWAFIDASTLQGKTIKIKADKLPDNSRGLGAIDQTSEIKNGSELYHEPLRQQFHFSSRHGWLNDPNGLVFYEGEYHLFYQHNPYGWNWGNMHWGHAISKDLVHWAELPEALYPDRLGTMFSGSAVVDWNNTAGFQTGKEPALVAMYTAAGHPFTQCLAFSNDRGRTWVKYEQNPVLGHIAAENRDPKVVWYAPEKKWVMSLYLDNNDFALFSSPDLKHWQKLSDFTLQGDAECPNFFEIPLNGDAGKKRWIFFGANGVYVVGEFDGQKFTPQTKPQRLHNGNAWYASQVYSDVPESDGRCILVPWGRLPSGEIMRGMSFNQMMGLPVELTLRDGPGGPWIKANPVRELASLRERTHTIEPQTLGENGNPLADVQGELLEIEAELDLGSAQDITFDLRGMPLNYNVNDRKLTCQGHNEMLTPKAGKIGLHIFIDRRSVDIFSSEGRVYMPMASALSPENRSLKLTAKGGAAAIRSLRVHELKSAW